MDIYNQAEALFREFYFPANNEVLGEKRQAWTLLAVTVFLAVLLRLMVGVPLIYYLGSLPGTACHWQMLVGLLLTSISGDISYQSGSTMFASPMATMILVSVMVQYLHWIYRRIFQ